MRPGTRSRLGACARHAVVLPGLLLVLLAASAEAAGEACLERDARSWEEMAECCSTRVLEAGTVGEAVTAFLAWRQLAPEAAAGFLASAGGSMEREHLACLRRLGRKTEERDLRRMGGELLAGGSAPCGRALIAWSFHRAPGRLDPALGVVAPWREELASHREALAAFARSPGAPGWSDVLAFEAALAAGRAEQALELIEEAPASPAATLRRARALAARGREKRASALLQELGEGELARLAPLRSEGDPPYEGLLAARALARSGEAGDAARTLAKLRDDYPDSPWIHYNHALALLRDERPEEALAALEVAAEKGMADFELTISEFPREEVRSARFGYLISRIRANGALLKDAAARTLRRRFAETAVDPEIVLPLPGGEGRIAPGEAAGHPRLLVLLTPAAPEIPPEIRKLATAKPECVLAVDLFRSLQGERRRDQRSGRGLTWALGTVELARLAGVPASDVTVLLVDGEGRLQLKQTWDPALRWGLHDLMDQICPDATLRRLRREGVRSAWNH